MMRSFVLGLAFLGLLAGPVQAGCRAAQGLPVPAGAGVAIPGQFLYRPETGLGCVVDHGVGEAMSAGGRPVSFLACLRLGPIEIAQRREAAEALLGPPRWVMARDEHTQFRGYEIAQRGQIRPRYLITYHDDVVVALQLAGPPTELPVTFAGFGLGAGAQQVVDALGPPNRACDQGHEGAQLWLWEPFPIAVDMAGGKVVAIRLTVPARRPGTDKAEE